jgi:hypothetical protein
MVRMLTQPSKYFDDDVYNGNGKTNYSLRLLWCLLGITGDLAGLSLCEITHNPFHFGKKRNFASPSVGGWGVGWGLQSHLSLSFPFLLPSTTRPKS